MSLKANCMVDIAGNNNTTADSATGNWAPVQDSVKITYTYVPGTIMYSLAGEHSTNANTMTGTVALCLVPQPVLGCLLLQDNNSGFSMKTVFIFY